MIQTFAYVRIHSLGFPPSHASYTLSTKRWKGFSFCCLQGDQAFTSVDERASQIGPSTSNFYIVNEASRAKDRKRMPQMSTGLRILGFALRNCFQVSFPSVCDC